MMNLCWLTSFIKFKIDGVIPKPCGMNLASIFQLSYKIIGGSLDMLSKTKSLPEKFSWVRTSDLLQKFFLLIRMLCFCFLHLNLTITVSFFQMVTCLKIIRFHFVARQGQCPAYIVFKSIITNRCRNNLSPVIHSNDIEH